VSSSGNGLTAGACGEALLSAGAALGFSPPDSAEARAARSMASELMGHEVAEVGTILALLTLQPGSTLVFREDSQVTGFASTLLLRSGAEAELLADRFDGLRPQEALLCRPDDPVGLYYVWGVAGSTKLATTAIMRFQASLRYVSLAHLTAYALAVTPAGRRAGLTQLDYLPARGPDDALIVGVPTAQRRAA
jgi:hypothetical protein